jgi:hypothetical protein
MDQSTADVGRKIQAYQLFSLFPLLLGFVLYVAFCTSVENAFGIEGIF